jgi:hypothetical protein
VATVSRGEGLLLRAEEEEEGVKGCLMFEAEEMRQTGEEEVCRGGAREEKDGEQGRTAARFATLMPNEV